MVPFVLHDRFRHCLGRNPTATETTRLWQLHEELKTQIKSQPGSTEKLAGPKPIPSEELETATSVTLSRILLNLDELVLRD